MIDLPLPDIIAFCTFFAGWGGYSMYADNLGHERRPVAVVMDDYRLRWMERMLERENRMPDVNIAVSFSRTAMMFASTSILLLAGAMAMLGQIGSVHALVAGVSYARPATGFLIELQLFTLTGIFAFAFFKFVWAIRLFNNLLVLIGAAPQPTDCNDIIRHQYPRHMTRFASRAFANQNGGTRAYTFGLGLLPWLLHPYLLIVSTLVVIAVLYRRDFRSVSLEALEDLRGHH